MISNKKIFWLAGESSGDIHSASILKELNSRHPNIINYGIGGTDMQKENFKVIFPFERFAVMGFVEVIKHIVFFGKVYRRIKNIFKIDPPNLVVLTDYPGFNMKIAKLAKTYEIPVLYFISPQFWAWKQKRIFQLKKYTDHVAYILPFEGKYFQETNVKASYVGHPIAEEIEIKLSKIDFAEKYDLDLDKKWLGFFPGSREIEISRLLPAFYAAIEYFETDKFEFLISRASSLSAERFQIHKKDKANVKTVAGDNHEMMKHCDFLCITSGTATLECAYIGTPFIIVYKTSNASYQIGKRLIKIDKIGLPNIIMEKSLLPELIQDEVSGEKIYKSITELLNDKQKYGYIEKELKNLHQILGKISVSKEVANIIEKLLDE